MHRYSVYESRKNVKEKHINSPCHTTNANFTLSLYSSFPNFILTYAYAASSSARLCVICAISPEPVPARCKLSLVAETY
jgi:hypothetical protein